MGCVFLTADVLFRVETVAMSCCVMICLVQNCILAEVASVGVDFRALAFGGGMVMYSHTVRSHLHTAPCFAACVPMSCSL